MEKRIILAKMSEELTSKQITLFAKDANRIEARIKAEEQKDWHRVDQIIKEWEKEPDATKGLRTKEYKHLIDSWEKETHREYRMAETAAIPKQEEQKMENFWRVRYHIDTKKQEKTSDINQILSFEGKPKPEFTESNSIIQYSEYFNFSDEPVAYKKMQHFQTSEFTDALKSLLSKRYINSKENLMSDEIENEGQSRDPKSVNNSLLESMSYIRKDIIENASIDPDKCFSYIKNIKGDVNAFNSYFMNQEGLRIAIVNYLNNEDKQIHLLMRQTIDNEAQKTKIEYFHFGKPFSLDNAEEFLEQYDAHSFAQETEQLKGKERIMTDKKPSEPPPLERRNINGKENFMSDEIEKEGQSRDPKEEAFLNTVHQRKVITDALKAGKLSCLPGADGYADTQPAVNLVNGTFYHGTNLLFLKEHQKENGFPSAEYLTIGQIDKARENNPDLFIRKGQHGVSIYVTEKNEETGEWENKSFRLFNVAQTTKPAVVKEWAEQQRQEKLQEKLEYLQTQYGTGYKLPEPQQKGPGPEIVCSSTDPQKYLGQYLAAVSMGGKFKASPEQASEFAQKLEGTLFERMDNGHTNPFKLEKISIEASQYCKEVIKEVRMEARKAEQPQQQQEQTQSRGRGM